MTVAWAGAFDHREDQMHGLHSVVKLRRFDHSSVHKNEIDHRWWSMHLDNPVVKHMFCLISVSICAELTTVGGVRIWKIRGQKCRFIGIAVSFVKLRRFDHRAFPTNGYFHKPGHGSFRGQIAPIGPPLFPNQGFFLPEFENKKRFLFALTLLPH